MRDDIQTIRVSLRARCAEVAERLLGQPTWRGRAELRWGRRGSLALAVARLPRRPVALSRNRNGRDLLALVMRERRCAFAEAVQFARGFVGEPQPSRKPRPAKPPPAPDNAEREAAALRLWHEARPSICGTPAEVYLRGRGIDPARLPPHAGLVGWPPALRWLAETGALLVAVNDARTGVIRAVQRIMLNADGTPRLRADGSKIKLCLGPVAGRAVRFAWQPDPQGRWALAEGVETALAAAQLLGIPVWASLGASNMPRIVPPTWAREATICADHDEPGLCAAQEAARLLRERGLRVTIITPSRERADAADLAKEVV